MLLRNTCNQIHFAGCNSYEFVQAFQACQSNFEREREREGKFLRSPIHRGLKYVARLRNVSYSCTQVCCVSCGHHEQCVSHSRILVKAGFPGISCSSNESLDINVKKRNVFLTSTRNVEFARFSSNFIDYLLSKRDSFVERVRFVYLMLVLDCGKEENRGHFFFFTCNIKGATCFLKR